MCARAETVERKEIVFHEMGTNVAKQMRIVREQAKSAFRRQHHPARVLASTEESPTPPGSSPRPLSAASSSYTSFQSQIPFSNPASVTKSEDSSGGGGPLADLADHQEPDQEGFETAGTSNESGDLRRDSSHLQSIVCPSLDSQAGADDVQSSECESTSQHIEFRWHYSSTADVSQPIVTRFVFDFSKTIFEIARQVSFCWPGRACGRIEGILRDGGQPLPLLADSQVVTYVDMASQHNQVPTFAVQVLGHRSL
ncbi:hypothetical protein DL767_010784 [Monosporascus sp. MG133]|nr:hypothetical protein DL767_010784 [Monosporascus sp. MG133]